MSRPKVPFKLSSSWPLAAAIGLNLIPVIGVLFWGWSAFALIVLYWLENVVIGVRTLAGMLAHAALMGDATWIGALFIGAFFTFHYGMFCFAHGVFVMAFFGGNLSGDSILDLGASVRALFASQTNLLVGFASIVAWQVVTFVRSLLRGELKRGPLLDMMGAPYPRIIVLHATIIFGGFVLLLLNQPVGGILVLALVKMAYDVGDVLRNAKPAGAPAGAVSA